MSIVPPLGPADEHGHRNHLRKYLQKFTTTIRRAGQSKDCVENSIPQPNSSAETKDNTEHSHDNALFDFSNIIAAEEEPTTNELSDQSSPGCPTSPMANMATFHTDRAAVYQDRVKRLHNRFGVDSDCSSSTARRVQKTPRMRVRRSCHMCGVDFGHGVHCRACHHRVCSNCPHAPGRRVQDVMALANSVLTQKPAESLEKSKRSVLPEEPAADPVNSPMELPILTGTNQHTLQQPTQLEFDAEQSYPSMSCKPDDHILSVLQPDDDACSLSPALLTRTARNGIDTCFLNLQPRSSRHVPNSLPNIRDPSMNTTAGVQRVYRKARQRVRFTCHECNLPFDHHGKVCTKCGHERCSECRNRSAGKVKAVPDPRLVDAVNQRLAEVGR